MAMAPNSYLIAVVGGKGGVGKSVFSANLALAFANELKQLANVLLVDADSQSCGDQNILLGIDDPKTWQEACYFKGAVNQQTLSQLCSPMQTATYRMNNAWYLAAVKNRDQKMQAPVDIAIQRLELLSNTFNHVVADLGSQLGPLQYKILERATVVVVVTTPDSTTFNQTLRLYKDLQSALIPQDIIYFAINRFVQGVSKPNLAVFGKQAFQAMIPADDVNVLNSIERRTPFTISGPQLPVSSAHYAITRELGQFLPRLKAAEKPRTIKFEAEADTAGEIGDNGQVKRSGGPRARDARTQIKVDLHEALLSSADLKKTITDFGSQRDPEVEAKLRDETKAKLSNEIDKIQKGLPPDERKAIIEEVMNEALGLGPLEDLLADDDISEIMVNGPDRIYIERKGRITRSTTLFTSGQQLYNVIQRIVTPLGRRIDDSQPYVDARLKDGSRVNAVISPLALDGHTVTIRKFRKKPITEEDYIYKFGACTPNMIEFLKIAVRQHRNIIVSGGTGSGKTTLLNLISSFIPEGERIITIEDAAELQMKQDHVVRLETKPANLEGKGAVSIRDLVRNSLRMRPDRIVVGETRDGAALDMLQAMNTGHDGSMTTVHSNNPREACTRLETLCMMSGMELPAKAIREQIAAAVHLIVQIQRLTDGTRKITKISEVQGMSGEVVTIQDVYEFKQQDLDKDRKIIGQFFSTGLTPKFVQNAINRGERVPADLFSNDGSGAKFGEAARVAIQGARPGGSGVSAQAATSTPAATGAPIVAPVAPQAPPPPVPPPAPVASVVAVKPVTQPIGVRSVGAAKVDPKKVSGGGKI